jgi:CRISPR-associated protein Cas2
VKRAYIVAYDVRDDRRLRRIYSYLRQKAVHVQYSVFVAHLARGGVERLLDELRNLIDEREDDVRIYPLPDDPEWTQLGEPTLPDSVYLLGGPSGDALIQAGPRTMLVERDKVETNGRR